MISTMKKVNGKLHADGCLAYRRRIIYKWDDVNNRVIATYFKTWYWRNFNKVRTWSGSEVAVQEFQTGLFRKDWTDHRGQKRRVGTCLWFGRTAIQELAMAIC